VKCGCWTNVGFETEVLLVVETAFVNRDWSRTLYSSFFVRTNKAHLVAPDFDIDTAKLLISYFVESFGGFYPQPGAYLSHHFLQDTDNSGDLDFTEVSMPVLVSTSLLYSDVIFH
jgi:hypothetical protein